MGLVYRWENILIHKIYQIILGDIPKYLEHCVDSVIDYSNRNRILYEQVTQVPEWCSVIKCPGKTFFDRFAQMRTISEWIRLELLATKPNILIVDWDIHLYDTFDIETFDTPIFSTDPMECMLFNSTNLEAFQEIKKINDIKNSYPGHLVLIDSIQKYIKANPEFQYQRFNTETYKHLDNCRLVRDKIIVS